MLESERDPPELVCGPPTELEGGRVIGTKSTDPSAIHSGEGSASTKVLIDWLDAEVKARLCDIDRKLDQLSQKAPFGPELRPDERGPGPKASARRRTHHTLRSEASSLSTRSPPSPLGRSLQPAPMRIGIAAPGRLSRCSTLSMHSVWSVDYASRQRLKVWTFMHDQDSSVAARCYAAAMRCLVWASVVVTLAQTVSPPPIRGTTATVLETIFDVLFLLEIIVRFTACPNRMHFWRSAYNIIDVAAAMPLFLRASDGFTPLANGDLGVCAPACVVLLFVVPIIRILKTLRTFRQFHLLLSAFVLAFEALPVLLFTMVVILMIFSSLIYLVESQSNSNIASLPTAMYFAIITMTTVGYGDISPETNAGHIVVSLCTVTGVLYMAMPIGIIGSAFTETWQRRDQILLTKRISENLLQWGHTVEDIPDLFEEFDVDGDGALNLREFRRMMKHLRIGLGDDRVIELFDSIDSDSGGSIDASEFMQMLFPQAFHTLFGTHEKLPKSRTQPSWAGMTSGALRALFHRGRGRNSTRPPARPGSAARHPAASEAGIEEDTPGFPIDSVTPRRSEEGHSVHVNDVTEI